MYPNSPCNNCPDAPEVEVPAAPECEDGELCEDAINGQCVNYTGAGVSCDNITIETDMDLDTIVDLLANAICDFTASSGISSLNGLTGATQTFVNDTNVTIVSSGTTHTLTWSGDLAFSRMVQIPTNTVVVNNTSGTADMTTLALSASNLLGRGSTGDIAAITLGTGLTMTGTVLSCTVTGNLGDFVGPASATDNAIVRFDTTTGKLGQNSVVTIADTTGLISINSTQVVYLPNQTNFTGSLIYGNGGGNLSHSSGSEGFYNTIVGIGTALSATTISYSTYLGYGIAPTATTANLNLGIGYQTLFNLTTGSDNTAVGNKFVLYNLSTGTLNTGLGARALYGVTTGSNNIGIGTDGGLNITTGSRNIVISYTGYVQTATSSDQLNIANAIYGTAMDGTTSNMSSGNIGLFCKAPGEMLSLGTTGTRTGVISFAGATSGKVIIQAASAAGATTLTLPVGYAAVNGYVLSSTTAGVLSWVAQSGGSSTADTYIGPWNASTNTSPTLVSSTGTEGQYYVVSVAGTTNLDGWALWAVNDEVIFNNGVWRKRDNSPKTTADVTVVTDKNYVLDADLTNLANLSGVNTGDQTSIVGITGSVSDFNSALTGDDFCTLANTVTLTNKRLTPRVQTVTSSATVTPSADNDDFVRITAQAAALTLANPSGTPVGGQAMIIRIKDDGNARAITFDTQYRAIGVTAPTTTVISKTLYLGLIYNSTDTKWDLIGVSQEA